MTYRVYLAGPISGLTYAGCTDWRDYVRQHLAPGIEGVSPMRGKNFLETKVGPISAHGRDYAENPLARGPGVTARDRFDVMRCDVMLVNLLGAEKASIGTMIEFGWADAHRKPIVLAMTDDDSSHDHLMVRTMAGYIVPTLDDAIAVVNAILGPPA